MHGFVLGMSTIRRRPIFALSTILRFTSSGTSGSQIYLLKYTTFQKSQGTGDIEDPMPLRKPASIYPRLKQA
ncbi:uncharacterized protein RSE6_01534 [Rhynchosporium secalis]|uniref:Uncharacterized protein n=1 Tax=Rhynchosporium secalis TaxID=38038 RepID=A0A1E1LZP8_RHYSE|nr:uncharacterized protein RSE6_01534 [Rhynchosporium secalis]